MGVSVVPLGPGFSHNELRLLVRKGIAQGRLPVFVFKQSNAQDGSGHPCEVCGQPIDREHTSYEVNVHGRLLQFHVVCFLVWQLECTSRLSREDQRHPRNSCVEPLGR